MIQPEKKRKFHIVRGLWEAWKRLGRRIADIQVRAILTLFYFVIFAPFALAVRWGTDPLAIKAKRSRGWQSMSVREAGPVMDEARRQF
jgi:hypothetical protein